MARRRAADEPPALPVSVFSRRRLPPPLIFALRFSFAAAAFFFAFRRFLALMLADSYFSALFHCFRFRRAASASLPRRFRLRFAAATPAAAAATLITPLRHAITPRFAARRLPAIAERRHDFRPPPPPAASAAAFAAVSPPRHAASAFIFAGFH